ncbi:MAG: hypothetical protein PHN29_06045, partial [Endomicrobiaceae bacterium]|nr:hypothetical protein [Endomicrobiaceae bacterium]
LVIDAATVTKQDADAGLISEIKQLAQNGGVILRIETDNDDNQITLMEDAINLLDVQGQKLSVNVKRTFIKSRERIMNVFKANPANEYRLNGLSESFDSVFGSVNPEIAAKELSEVLSGDMAYDKFESGFETKFSSLFVDKSVIKAIMNMTEMPGYYKDYTNPETKQQITLKEVKMMLIRQYIIGVFIANINNEIIPEISADMPFDMNKMKLNAKQIVVYEIMQLLMAGNSVAAIKSYEFKPDQSRPLSDMVNDIIQRGDIKSILKEWNMTDMVIKTLDNSKAAERMEDIHTLILDSINIDNIGDKIAIASLDGIKATLSAA